MVSATSRSDRAWPVIHRVGWLLIAIAHLPALVHAWRGFFAGGLGVEHLGGCVGLSLSIAFFALKVLDVSYLRFCTGRRSKVAFVMVVTLLHVDLIRPGSDPSIVPDCTAVLATALIIGTLPLVRRGWERVFVHTEAAIRRRLPAASSHDTIWLSESRPHCWVAVLHLFNLRAPPA